MCACSWASLTQTGRSEIRTTEAARLNHLQRCSPGTPIPLPSHHQPMLPGTFYVLGLFGAWGDKVCPQRQPETREAKSNRTSPNP